MAPNSITSLYMSASELTTSEGKHSYLQELETLLLQSLKCAVCHETSAPPIFECPNHHIVCCKCQTGTSSCPVCVSGVMTRSSFAEMLSTKMKLPCALGCGEHVTRDKMAAHVTRCPHRTHECELDDAASGARCGWRGKLGEMERHVEVAHPGRCHHGASVDLTINPTVGATLDLRLVIVCRQPFWCLLEYLPGRQLLYAHAHHVGDPPARFRYVVHMTASEGDNALRYAGGTLAVDAYEGFERSCVVHRYMMRAFSRGDGGYTCTMTIEEA